MKPAEPLLPENHCAYTLHLPERGYYVSSIPFIVTTDNAEQAFRVSTFGLAWQTKEELEAKGYKANVKPITFGKELK